MSAPNASGSLDEQYPFEVGCTKPYRDNAPRNGQILPREHSSPEILDGWNEPQPSQTRLEPPRKLHASDDNASPVSGHQIPRASTMAGYSIPGTNLGECGSSISGPLLQLLESCPNTIARENRPVDDHSFPEASPSKEGHKFCSSPTQDGTISSLSFDDSNHGHSSCAQQLVFDAYMRPATVRKRKRKTEAQLEAARAVRKVGVCQRHKAAKKAVLPRRSPHQSLMC
jgi:hypothetical protein